MQDPRHLKDAGNGVRASERESRDQRRRHEMAVDDVGTHLGDERATAGQGARESPWCVDVEVEVGAITVAPASA